MLAFGLAGGWFISKRALRPIGAISAAAEEISTSNLDRRIDLEATETELADAAARADRTGMFNCPHTAVALAALEKLITRGEIGKTDRVVVISTANGLKFSEFKTAYHTRRLAGVAAKHANPPVELPNDFDAVRRAIEKHSGWGVLLDRLSPTFAPAGEDVRRTLGRPD